MKRMIPSLPSREKMEAELEKMRQKRYEEEKSNLNNMSYWLPKVIGCGINIPQTVIIPLSYKQHSWFSGDSYSEEDIKSMGNYINDFLIKSEFNTNQKLFLKTGNFSNKFDFNTCCIDNTDTIGEQFLSIYYAAMMVGAGNSTELVVREFIENTETKPTIYNGMPLNTEFRAFYDFDNKKLLGVFNYWDTEVVGKSLEKRSEYSEEEKKEYLTFMDFSKSIESEFENLKSKVENLISNSMQKVDLAGVWSVDLMYANNDFYLIDMAEAHKSYYFDKVAHLI